MKWRRTCLEVGDNGAAGEGSFGGIKGHRVAGAWLKVGQLVLLLVSLHKKCISRHWKTEAKLTFGKTFFYFHDISRSHCARFCLYLLQEFWSFWRISTFIRILVKFIPGYKWNLFFKFSSTDCEIWKRIWKIIATVIIRLRKIHQRQASQIGFYCISFNCVFVCVLLCLWMHCKAHASLPMCVEEQMMCEGLKIQLSRSVYFLAFGRRSSVLLLSVEK